MFPYLGIESVMPHYQNPFSNLQGMSPSAPPGFQTDTMDLFLQN